MGIASASVRLMLRITYTDNGGMVATGTFNVSIRICWCYTLRVSRTAQKVFSGSSKSNGSGARLNTSRPRIRTLSAVTPTAFAQAKGAEKLADAPDYGLLPAIDVAAAVNDYFDTLAVYRSEP